MRREIVLDTETTGLDWAKGDRIIEIGGVELSDLFPTGVVFHEYIDPQREVHPDAVRVHGVTNEMLKGKPLFEAVAQKFIDFIGDATLVIHNASFDIGFLNAEFQRLKLAPIGMERVIDTLQIARRKHPGSANNLDALCARYGIDNSRRAKHGALLDAEILAEVYAEMNGGRQAGFDLTAMPAPGASQTLVAAGVAATFLKTRPEKLLPRLTEDEFARHRAFAASLGEKAIWKRYVREEDEAAAASS
ncbi:MAG: DNA polymerase III subunit epsilon [Rhizobiales bacterium 65-9]|nr:DNA polymerase III subunit epsilon [Hyphomicrobiales bacterium]OJY34602.1 MAG: DNA polymerase III subunit epsilon [Rhizobiales bacterium 65-9]